MFTGLLTKPLVDNREFTELRANCNLNQQVNFVKARLPDTSISIMRLDGDARVEVKTVYMGTSGDWSKPVAAPAPRVEGVSRHGVYTTNNIRTEPSFRGKVVDGKPQRFGKTYSQVTADSRMLVPKVYAPVGAGIMPGCYQADDNPDMMVVDPSGMYADRLITKAQLRACKAAYPWNDGEHLFRDSGSRYDTWMPIR